MYSRSRFRYLARSSSGGIATRRRAARMMQALACCLLLVEPSWAFGLGSHQPQAVVRAAQLSARAMAAPVASLPELKNDLMVRMARGARQEGGTGFGQLALRRLLSAPCLRLLLAPASQPASQPVASAVLPGHLGLVFDTGARRGDGAHAGVALPAGGAPPARVQRVQEDHRQELPRAPAVADRRMRGHAAACAAVRPGRSNPNPTPNPNLTPNPNPRPSP